MMQYVEVPNVPSSQFNGDHTVKFTTKIADLTPIKVINQKPGDSFKLNYQTAFNFPPLVAPAYQALTLKQYTFRVRKALTWSTDAVGKYITSLVENKTAPAQPRIDGNNFYWFGQSFVGVRFTPHLPVYGKSNGDDLYLQVEHLPASLTMNDMLRCINDRATYGVNATLFTEEYFKTMFTPDFSPSYYDVTATQAYDDYIEHDTLKHTFYLNNNWDLDSSNCLVFADTLDYFSGAETTIDGVKYKKGQAYGNCLRARAIRPLCEAGSLAEALGYPVSNFFENGIYPSECYDFIRLAAKAMRKAHSKASGNPHTESVGGTKNYVPGDSIWVNTSEDNYLQMGAENPSNWIQLSGVYLQTMYISYITWAINNGYGDGTIPPDDECPFVCMIPLGAIFDRPSINSTVTDAYDAGRLIAFWKVYDEYFRDPNLTKPLCFTPFTNTNSSLNDTALGNLKLAIAANGGYDMDGENISFMTSTNLAQFYDWFIQKYIRTMPRKMLDKDYFSALLPQTTKIEVFAPTCSASDALSLASLHGAEQAVTQTFNSANAVVDYKPATLTSTASGTFLSVDAFRTAEILQQFFKNAMLCGGKPAQTIVLLYGVHSKDFRNEVPELLSVNESPIRIDEITQQSETAEMSIGTEAGKMYCVSNQDSIYVQDDGDMSYIITMCCVYPNTTLIGTLDKEIMASDPWETLPQAPFAVLGEEEVEKGQAYYGLSVKSQNYKAYNTLGYAPRYARFKFQFSETHGRFRTDMNYYTLDRNQSPYDDRPALNKSFIETPRDLRIFASDEEANCYGISVCKCQFERKLPPYVLPVIG